MVGLLVVGLEVVVGADVFGAVEVVVGLVLVLLVVGVLVLGAVLVGAEVGLVLPVVDVLFWLNYESPPGRSCL